MATKLFETDKRDEAHRRLEEFIKTHPEAECREAGDVFSVWDGPFINPAIITVKPQPEPTISPVAPALKLKLDQSELEQIANLLAEKLRGGN